MPPEAMFPEPVSERFQPLRSGLINLYKYEDQEFWFERGRLLLRGNNGTGKSRVLALQLPFLFDGEISSHRVEPDGDPAKAMAWHLLMNEYEDRVGYTWIEFGRKPKDGPAIFVTLGCGMRAIKGVDGLPNRWYFVTGKRVRRDFPLLTEHRQPLSREQLAAAIGEEALYRKAQDYRHAVDAQLFGLKTRYDSLVELLIRLRAPQLARKLDEERLSSALGDALPPLGDALVGDIAESFRNLDSLRADLDSHRQVQHEVSEFLLDYRRYLQVGVRRRADGVRTLHSRYEDTNREIAERTRGKEAATSRIVAAEDAKRAAEIAAKEASSQLEALHDSPFQRDVVALDSARRHAEDCGQRLAHAIAEALSREQRANDAQVDQTNKQVRAYELYEELAGLLDEVSKAAERASFLSEHQRHLPGLAAWSREADWLAQARSILEARVRRQGEAIAHLTGLYHAFQAVQQELRLAQERETSAELRVTTERESERQHEEQVASLSERLVADYSTWIESLVWMHPAESADLIEGMARWLETGLGADRVLPLILEQAVTAAEGERRRELANVEQRLAELARQIEPLESEQSELESGRHSPPLVPLTRDPQVREQIEGAPLWQVCDFREHLNDDERAGLEAALESAGLLDALILPGGALVPAACDTFLAHALADAFVDASADASAAMASKTLTLWLQPSLPEEDPRTAALTPTAVAAALEYVGAEAGSGRHWVDLDGCWQLGPVRGRGQKARAQHLGEGARENARRRRLAELRDQLAVLDVERRQVEDQRQELMTTRMEAIQSERISAPNDDAIATAITLRGAARERIASARLEYEATQKVTATARQKQKSSSAELERTSIDLGLEPWKEKPEALRGHWQDYLLQLGRLWPTARLWDDARQQVEQAIQAAAQARGDATGAEARRLEAETQSMDASARYSTLQANVGSSVAKLHAEMSSAKIQLQQAQADTESAANELIEAKTAAGVAEEQLQQLNTRLAETVRDRGIAIDKVRLLAQHGLFADAHPTFANFEPGESEAADFEAPRFEAQEFEPSAWSITRAVEVAREIERTLRDVAMDDNTWRNRQTALFQHFNELQTSLGAHGHQPQMEYVDESLVAITCSFHGRPQRLGQLHRAVTAEITTQERLLTEREREVIDNHLIGEVATSLQDLIRDAEVKVADMNAEIMRCSTSTGLTMRLKWEPRREGMPEGLEEARRLLLADSQLWSPQERTELGEFLHGLIKDARTANPLGVWADHLRQALDYRAWHHFAVERRQNDKWEKLTRRRYGTGSGGEKALMLTVPQMAAAAAHYRSASPHAPRLILLDEVFVGIDSRVRAKCMGLLEAFDLDFIMTSEREWGAYPTIKGLAIYQLITHPGIEAIATTRWVWNGREKTLSNPVVTPLATIANGDLSDIRRP